MEKTYKNIGYFFIALWIIVLIGFHQTYTVFFPTFKGFRWEQHFHGAMLMVQPFLIKFGKQEWHRAIGKIGYVLAPLVCFSILEVTRMVYFRETAHRPEDEVLAQLSLDIPAILTFGLFALLAFVYQKQPTIHMRYMIATSLPMIGPGLGRALIIFGGIPLSNKDYIRMLKMVNELIRRNPYSDKLYLQRAKIEQELGQLEVACSDYKKILYFLSKTRFLR